MVYNLYQSKQKDVHKMKAGNNIRLGFIGVGDMARVHVTDLLQFPGWEIKAIADISELRMDSFNSRFKISPEKYTDYRKLVEREDIDAIFICSPNNLHKEHACAAFEHDKHVLLQKPMALNIPDCNAIIKAAEKAKKILQVGLVYRYSPLFRNMAALINNGRIGTPLMAWCHEFRVPFPIGREREWRYSQEESGGSLVEKDCHHFDLMQWMLGARPVKVHAFGGQSTVQVGGRVMPGVPGEPYTMNFSQKNNIIDHAWVNIEYEGNKSGNLGLCLFATSREMPFGIIGDKGWIEANVHTRKINLFDGRPGLIENIDANYKAHELADMKGITDTGHSGGAAEVLSFLECIKKGEPAYCNGKIGRDSLLAAISGEISIAEKRIVEISELGV